MNLLKLVICSVVLFGACVYVYADNNSALKSLDALETSALLVLDSSGKPVYSKQPRRMLIPASTVKLVTSLIALEHWGRTHRFATEFYINEAANELVIKGLGDPFLVSEEIDLIVEEIKTLGIEQLNGIYADVSYFADSEEVAGQGITNNPYDASTGALAANFNTIEVKVKNLSVTSAEPQTPITPLAKSLARGLPAGKHRINLGAVERAPQYFIEVLSEKLRRAGVIVNRSSQQQIKVRQGDLSLLFTHFNSRTLNQVIAAMLKYSNNFIANQLFLMLGAEQYGAPANLAKSQDRVKRFVEANFNWPQYALYDGAGLSRDNRLNARQLVDVLQKFSQYRDLMPTQSSRIRAKSGTLNGVSCYAGYVMRDAEWNAFALLINQPVTHQFRERIAEVMLRYSQRSTQAH